jgi:uncharacterized protein (DUF1330 family)
MNSSCLQRIVSLMAIAFGALTMTLSVHPAYAQTPTSVAASAPGYLIVLGRSTDRAKIIAYSATLPPIYAQTGGRYIGIGRPGGGVSCLYGLCEGRSAVIAYWRDEASINKFWWGDAYRQAVRLRDNAGVFTVVGMKGFADVAPFESSGALMIATMSGAAESGAAQAWVNAATEAGGKLLAPITPAALIPLEGDALYNRLALINFPSKEKRDLFAASEATKALIKNSTAQQLISLIAIDSPPPLPPPAPAPK